MQYFVSFAYSWQFIATVLGGVVMVGFVAIRPKALWETVIFVSIVSCGVFVCGYPVLDEVFLGCILLGALLAISVGGLSRRKSGRNRLHAQIFFLLVAYMVFQSIRGLPSTEDWLRTSRWIIFYGMLGMLSYVVRKWDFPVPSARKVLLVVVAGTGVYLSLYVGHGIFSEYVRGISRWDVQGVEWAGSAYAVFPLVVGMPAALLCANDRARVWKCAGYGLFGIMMVSAFYYLSRISWLAILAFFIISPTVLRLKKVILFIFLAFLTGMLISFSTGEDILKDIAKYGNMVVESARALYVPRSTDIDRQLHLRSSFLTASKDWTTLMFGYGTSSHHHVMRPDLQELYNEYLPGVEVKDFVRTTGFAALVVDTGLLGLLLLLGNFLLSARAVVRRIGPRLRGRRVVLLLGIALTFLWILVTNVQDMVLFYLLVFPFGIFVQLSCHPPEKRPATCLQEFGA